MEQVRKTGCGLGLLSEHGLEASHQYIGELLKTYQHMKKQPIRMYSYCMRRHLTGIMPEVVKEIRKPEPRKPGARRERET